MEAQLAELPMMDAPPGAKDQPLVQRAAVERPSPDHPSPDHPAAEHTAAAVSLQLAQSGSDEGFRQLLRLHQSRVFSIALRFTGRRTEAEELAQDVFVQLHGALAQIESPAHLTHWLLRAITHRCIDRQRRERRRPHLVPIESLHDLADAAPADGGDPLIGARLRRLLFDLAPDARAVMLLRFQEDLDPADIAATLRMSVNTVKSHLRRSLDTLRARCAGEDHGY